MSCQTVLCIAQHQMISTAFDLSHIAQEVFCQSCHICMHVIEWCHLRWDPKSFSCHACHSNLSYHSVLTWDDHWQLHNIDKPSVLTCQLLATSRCMQCSLKVLKVNRQRRLCHLFTVFFQTRQTSSSDIHVGPSRCLLSEKSADCKTWSITSYLRSAMQDTFCFANFGQLLAKLRRWLSEHLDLLVYPCSWYQRGCK